MDQRSASEEVETVTPMSSVNQCGDTSYRKE
jgi:hypothetical protein